MFNIVLVVSSPSFLNTWPYHRSRFFLRNVVIDSTLVSLQMSSLLMWSFLVSPLAHLSILISVVCSFCVSFFFTAQHSDPYIIAGLTMVLCNTSFSHKLQVKVHILKEHGSPIRTPSAICHRLVQIPEQHLYMWVLSHLPIFFSHHTR